MSHEPFTTSSSSPQTGVRPTGPGANGRQGAGAGGGRHAALSSSQAKGFMQYPLMLRLRMVNRLPESGSLATHKGTVARGVLERLYDLPALERLPQAILELLFGRWASHREKNPEVTDLFEDVDQVETWLEEAHGPIRIYFTLESLQRLEPAERELFIQTETDDGLLLRDFVDRLDVAPDDAMRVVDHKTERSPGTRLMEEVLLQMHFYALMLWRLRGRAPARLRLVYLEGGRVLTHGPRLAELERTETCLIYLWDEVEDYARNGFFHPRHSRLCDWCAFQVQCPLFGGTTSQVPDDGIARLLTARRTAA